MPFFLSWGRKDGRQMAILGLLLFVEAVGDDDVDTEDAAGVDEDLGEDVEDAVVDLAGRGKEQCYEGEDNAEDEHRDGGVFFEFEFHTASIYDLIREQFTGIRV